MGKYSGKTQKSRDVKSRLNLYDDYKNDKMGVFILSPVF